VGFAERNIQSLERAERELVSLEEGQVSVGANGEEKNVRNGDRGIFFLAFELTAKNA
jgi:hypothetical protein